MSAWKDLFNALSRKPEKIPPGWLTAKQIAKETGKTRSGVAKYLPKGVRAGNVECRKFIVKVGNRIMSAPHYRIIDNRKGK